MQSSAAGEQYYYGHQGGVGQVTAGRSGEFHKPKKKKAPCGAFSLFARMSRANWLQPYFRLRALATQTTEA